MTIAVVTLNPRGRRIARRLRQRVPEADLFLPTALADQDSPFSDLRELVADLFSKYQGIVFIMPVGIVVRMIARHVRDKHTDPAIVVMDEAGRYAISLLSGHEGGANRFALRVANATGAEPVITTAAEVSRSIVVGVGARRGVSHQAVRQSIASALESVGSNLDSVRWVATIEEKASEPGIVAACAALGLSIRTFSKERIARFQGDYQRSAFVKEKIGVEGVCEPCVLLSGKEMRLLLPKTASGGVTVAVGKEAST
jgi:cobalt-precorrin 5A hydrolase